ncbi:MAG: hypothetical protein NTW84_02790, partial [Methanothrix sp.]|nr:hypothetical protein [Methanothrix sp.]
PPRLNKDDMMKLKAASSETAAAAARRCLEKQKNRLQGANACAFFDFEAVYLAALATRSTLSLWLME